MSVLMGFYWWDQQPPQPKEDKDSPEACLQRLIDFKIEEDNQENESPKTED